MISMDHLPKQTKQTKPTPLSPTPKVQPNSKRSSGSKCDGIQLILFNHLFFPTFGLGFGQSIRISGLTTGTGIGTGSCLGGLAHLP